MDPLKEMIRRDLAEKERLSKVLNRIGLLSIGLIVIGVLLILAIVQVETTTASVRKEIIINRKETQKNREVEYTLVRKLDSLLNR